MGLEWSVMIIAFMQGVIATATLLIFATAGWNVYGFLFKHKKFPFGMITLAVGMIFISGIIVSHQPKQGIYLKEQLQNIWKNNDG